MLVDTVLHNLRCDNKQENSCNKYHGLYGNPNNFTIIWEDFTPFGGAKRILYYPSRNNYYYKEYDSKGVVLFMERLYERCESYLVDYAGNLVYKMF